MVISREAAFKFHNRRGRGYAFVQVILVFHSPWEGAVFVYVCLAQFSFRALFFGGVMSRYLALVMVVGLTGNLFLTGVI